MKKLLMLFLSFSIVAVAMAGVSCEVKAVEARQRYPWNGLVDIVVTIQGNAEEMNEVQCTFVATNSSTLAVVPVTSVTQVGTDSISGNVCTRRFLWNAVADVGAVKIEDIALTVGARLLGGVQLWENGPYWAECNVGATKPEECGYYFWWGDTVGCCFFRNSPWDYGWASVKDGTSSPFNSCPTDGLDNSQLQSAGYIDSTGNLVAAHDAATAYLGFPWRMPTASEFDALISNCTTTEIWGNGRYGLLVMGKGAYATKSIFLPYAGYGDSCTKCSGNQYRSSTPYYDWVYDIDSAWGVGIGVSGMQKVNYCSRRLGYPVRPIRGFDK